MLILAIGGPYASAPVTAPTGLSANSTTTTSTVISFTAPTNDGGAAITNYEYSTNGSTWTALSPADAASPVTITGLSSNTAYTIYLRAVNIVGSGPSSSGVAVTTLAGAPTGLSTTSTTTTTATISFTAPSGSATITNYEYSTNGSTWTAFSPADSASPVTVTGLTANTSYTIYLRAVNAGGSGTASSGVAATTQQAAPTSLEFLVLAGGGTGGYNGGGGGAGGYRASVPGEGSGGGAAAESALAVSGGGVYTVTVGAGGSNYPSTSGNNSVLGSITSIGGGKAGHEGGVSGSSGGSGGGGTYDGNVGGGGAGTANQGYAGNGVQCYSRDCAGGGGGAGGTPNQWYGGSGKASTITGSSVTRASGGSGGGNGGGGGAAAGANTGSGGSGNTANNWGGTGGSGIVVIRYSNTFANLTSVSGGLTYSFNNTGGYKIYTFTAGTGTITI